MSNKVKKLIQEMRVGKKIYTMNPYGNRNPEKVTIRCLTITSRIDERGRFEHIDEINGYASHSYIQDNLMEPKFIGFTYQAAKRALKKYQASPEQQRIVKDHHARCGNWMQEFGE